MTDNNVKLNNKVLEIFWPVIYFTQMHEKKTSCCDPWQFVSLIILKK